VKLGEPFALGPALLTALAVRLLALLVLTTLARDLVGVGKRPHVQTNAARQWSEVAGFGEVLMSAVIRNAVEDRLRAETGRRA
jgi:hypothetical protein